MHPYIAEIIKHFRSAADAARALGISRQAMNAAIKRGHLSDALRAKAAALLSIDNAAPRLADNHPAPPILDTAPDAARDTLYYVK